MQVTEIVPRSALSWRCIGGHDNWQDNEFRFELVPLEPSRTRLRFWQEYATELSDDDYGIYNFNWGYYLESLRLLCTTRQRTTVRPRRRIDVGPAQARPQGKT